MSKFQIILLSVFGAFILIAVLLFSLSKGSNGSSTANVLVWGDIPANEFNSLLNLPSLTADKNLIITYREIDSENFDKEFTDALAEGFGPDLIVLPLNKLWKHKNKILPMTYERINEGDFKDTFIEEGELFLSQSGVYALPLTIDPMVLYWNRDLFTKASLTKPPVYWDEIYTFAEKLTVKDGAGNIIKSAVTLGESKNIPHSKDILSLLMLQAGTPITGTVGPELRSQISARYDLPLVPAEAAVDFYTQFANSGKPFYSWNRSLKQAQTAFVAGDVAMYLGFASELNDLKAKNPNLNLGVTAVPQSRVSGKSITFGDIKGLAIVRSVVNEPAAFKALTILVSNEVSLDLSNKLGLPPPRLDLLSKRPNDAVQTVFYSAALQSRGFIDPDNEKTEDIFVNMIDSITSGRARLQEAVSIANTEMDILISN